MGERIRLRTRRELTTAIRQRYQAADRRSKRLILDEFIKVTSYHRKHAIRMLTSSPDAIRSERGSQRIFQLVPVRTFSDWGEVGSGCMEMDPVVHCGAKAQVSFVHTLVLTDVASGWTECIALPVREQALILEAFTGLRSRLPFALRGVDTENGSAFLNDTLWGYCDAQGIVFTRSRSHRKNNQAWMKQKNGAIVRKLIGYGRLEGLSATAALRRLYEVSRLYINFFQPSFKLKSKRREGARVHKKYHAPETPCRPLLEREDIDPEKKQALRKQMESLDPVLLLKQIRKAQDTVRAPSQIGVPSEFGYGRDVTRWFRTGLSGSGPFGCRCLIIHSVPRLHIPLIEPDMRISRIRLSDRTSCLRPRKALRKLRQADESHLLIEELVGIALQSPAALLVLLADPPAQPGRGVSVEESIRFRDRTKLEVVGPSTQLLIQTSHHVAGIHPFQVPVSLDTHSLSHAPDALTRRPCGDIRPPGFRRVALTKGVPQEVELLFRNAARLRLFFVHRQLQLAHQPPHGFQRLEALSPLQQITRSSA